MAGQTEKVVVSASYSSPVSELLTFGDCRDFREWPDYLDLGLRPEHVPELIELATDKELNWADPESLEVWAPVHAWRALGQLRAVPAIERRRREAQRIPQVSLLR
jgi:hypothetical protein